MRRSAGKSVSSSARQGIKWQTMPPSKASEDTSGAGRMNIALDDLVKKSKPIAVAKTAAPEKKLPAWGNAPLGASPNAQTRLQDIQVILSSRWYSWADGPCLDFFWRYCSPTLLMCCRLTPDNRKPLSGKATYGHICNDIRNVVCSFLRCPNDTSGNNA